MREFKDCEGRTWQVKVTVNTLSRVHAETGVDLSRIFTPESESARAIGDYITAFRVLAVVLRPQIEQRNLTVDQFGDALDSEDVATAAASALAHAVIDFFRPSKAEAMHRAVTKMRQALDAAQTEAVREINQAVDNFDPSKALKTSSAAAGGSPESSASTPASEPPGNSSG